MNKFYKSVIVLQMLLFMVMVPLQAADPLDQVELKVDGMGCPYCSLGFIKKVKKLGDVQDIDSEYETGIFMFKIPTAEGVSIDDLKKLTKDAGYTLVYAKIERIDGKVEQFGEVEDK